MHQTHLIVLPLLLVIAALSSCGQTGPLYLPDDDSQQLQLQDVDATAEAAAGDHTFF